MTNEEYRQYIHKMYKENFLDNGKKPKWIQIFGDSYSHFCDEGTWPYELSKKLECPVFTFASAGANNLRTLSYFHEYYDEDCLNIVCITSPGRIYLEDDCFMLESQLLNTDYPKNFKILGTNSWRLSEDLKDKIIDAGIGYYNFLAKKEVELITSLNLFKSIFYLKNVIVLNMFDTRPIGWYNPGIFETASSKFFEFYDVKFPELFNSNFMDISWLQFIAKEKRPNTLLEFSFMNIEPAVQDKAKEAYLTFMKDGDTKNHFGKKLQEQIGRMFGDILLTGHGNFSIEDISRPSGEQRVVQEGWLHQRKYKKELAEKLHIPLTQKHLDSL